MVSAALELLLSALQAPLRMLAHSAFVLGALTGLRLDWKSPSRDALAVTLARRLGRHRPAGVADAGVALLALQGRAVAPHLAPLLLPLLLAVPLAVLSSHPRIGAALRAVRMLWVPEERRVPRTLQRAGEQRGFADLVPLRSTMPPRVQAPAYASRRVATQRLGLALGSMAAALFVALTPGHAITPELPAAVRVQMELQAALQALPVVVETPTPVMFSADSSQKRSTRVVRERPARMIDDAVRQRALDAVQRMTTSEDWHFEPA